jgi:hypothetical protein
VSLERFGELVNLENLDVSHNKLKGFSDLKSCTKLTTLNIAHNEIPELDVDTLSVLYSIRCLCIYDNPFSVGCDSYQDLVLESVPSLEFLDKGFVKPFISGKFVYLFSSFVVTVKLLARSFWFINSYSEYSLLLLRCTS